MSVENEVTMSDDAISAIAKLLQVAILTGTDIVDNLRTLRLTVDGDQLTVSPTFVENFERNIEKFGSKTAIIWEPNDPNEKPLQITYNELFQKTCQFSNVLKTIFPLNLKYLNIFRDPVHKARLDTTNKAAKLKKKNVKVKVKPKAPKVIKTLIRRK